MVGTRLSALVSGYALVFILLSVVIVPHPVKNTTVTEVRNRPEANSASLNNRKSGENNEDSYSHVEQPKLVMTTARNKTI